MAAATHCYRLLDLGIESDLLEPGGFRTWPVKDEMIASPNGGLLLETTSPSGGLVAFITYTLFKDASSDA